MQTNVKTDNSSSNNQEPPKKITRIKELLSFGHKLTLTALTVLFGMNVYMERDRAILDNLSFIHQLRSQREQAGQNQTCAQYQKFTSMGSKGSAQALSRLHQLMYSPSRLDLKGMDLSGVQLQELTFFGLLTLKDGASLVGDDLTCTDLSDANLTGVNLTNVDLSGAKLNRAKLNGAKLDGAKLNRAKLDGAKLNGAKLNGVDLTGAKLSGVDLTGAELSAKLDSFKDIKICGVTGVDGKPVDNIGNCDSK
jgi:uncharacterized protein YjbI with pentapeptide repeats